MATPYISHDDFVKFATYNKYHCAKCKWTGEIGPLMQFGKCRGCVLEWKENRGKSVDKGRNKTSGA